MRRPVTEKRSAASRQGKFPAEGLSEKAFRRTAAGKAFARLPQGYGLRQASAKAKALSGLPKARDFSGFLNDRPSLTCPRPFREGSF
jgi:hypothetical protein